MSIKSFLSDLVSEAITDNLRPREVIVRMAQEWEDQLQRDQNLASRDFAAALNGMSKRDQESGD